MHGRAWLSKGGQDAQPSQGVEYCKTYQGTEYRQGGKSYKVVLGC